MENKTYKLDVMEKRTYYNDIVIQIKDNMDIDTVCNHIEAALNGDIWNINYLTGAKIMNIFEDESPECECKVLDYKELLMFSRMKSPECEYEVLDYSEKNDEQNSCEGCKNISLWENEYENGISCPCLRCVRRAKDNYEPERRADGNSRVDLS